MGGTNPDALTMFVADVMSKHNILYYHAREPMTKRIGEKLEVSWDLLLMRWAFSGTFIATKDYDRDDGNLSIVRGYANLIAYGQFFLPSRIRFVKDPCVILPLPTLFSMCSSKRALPHYQDLFNYVLTLLIEILGEAYFYLAITSSISLRP